MRDFFALDFNYVGGHHGERWSHPRPGKFFVVPQGQSFWVQQPPLTYCANTWHPANATLPRVDFMKRPLRRVAI